MEEDPILPEPMDLEDLPPLPDLSQIYLDPTTMDGLTPSTDSESEESIILPRNWRNVQPRDVGTTIYTWSLTDHGRLPDSATIYPSLSTISNRGSVQ